VVGIGGTIGGVSSTERALAIALDAAEREGFATRMFGGADMARLPLYDPKATTRTDDERAFVDAVRRASAVIIASPGYHGSISGVVKNALDLLEETAQDARPYLADMPVGLIATAYGWQATGSTIAALRSIVTRCAAGRRPSRRRSTARSPNSTTKAARATRPWSSSYAWSVARSPASHRWCKPDAGDAPRLRTLRRGPARERGRRLHLLVRVHLLRRLRRCARRALPQLRRRAPRPPHPHRQGAEAAPRGDRAAVPELRLSYTPPRWHRSRRCLPS
jgi:NAD(P)H-dependent FMN reductase